MHKVLLFDFDGTIADSFGDFLTIVDRLVERYNLPKLSPEEIEKLRAVEARTLIRKLRIPFYKIPLFARDMKHLQKETITNISPFPGLPEVLRKLHDTGYRLGIMTSNSRENVELFLTKNNIDVFDYLYTDASLFGKAAMLRKFMKQEKFSSHEIYYIGDEIRDIQACQKAGVRIIAVTWGFNSAAGLMRYSPDHLIDRPAELLQYVKTTANQVS